jgi:hypothetical protein
VLCFLCGKDWTLKYYSDELRSFKGLKHAVPKRIKSYLLTKSTVSSASWIQNVAGEFCSGPGPVGSCAVPRPWRARDGSSFQNTCRSPPSTQRNASTLKYDRHTSNLDSFTAKMDQLTATTPQPVSDMKTSDNKQVSLLGWLWWTEKSTDIHDAWNT